MFSGFIVKINNFVVRLRSPKIPAGNVLLLAPRCIHRGACRLNVEDDIGACALCGKCNVKELAEISKAYGVRCRISRGGREAVRYAGAADVQGVVAVACFQELAAGILAVFPKPVMAVPNCQPNGACCDTCVDAAAVRRALDAMVDPKRTSAST